MKFDFTLERYEEYLKLLKRQQYDFVLFNEYLAAIEKPNKFCLIRHDVDRFPKRALRMAKLESNLNIQATYYFRTKSFVLRKKIVKAISSYGHEIGYHYESLSDSKGDVNKGIKNFKKNLDLLREVVPIMTCSMHGRPFSSYDNRDLWISDENHRKLVDDFKLLGEIYLDIDYKNIAYISDTGRNWTNSEGNRRDKVDSNILVDFDSSSELKKYLSKEPHDKLVFQIHPERWNKMGLHYAIQLIQDKVINIVKFILR